MNDKDQGYRRYLRYRREVPERVIASLREEAGTDGDRRTRQQQRIAVSGRFGHQLGSDVSAGPPPEIRHDRLSKRLAQLIREEEGQELGRAAWERYHQPDALLRILLGQGRQR